MLIDQSISESLKRHDLLGPSKQKTRLLHLIMQQTEFFCLWKWNYFWGGVYDLYNCL